MPVNKRILIPQTETQKLCLITYLLVFLSSFRCSGLLAAII
jgi:hypothetical protein